MAETTQLPSKTFYVLRDAADVYLKQQGDGNLWSDDENGDDVTLETATHFSTVAEALRAIQLDGENNDNELYMADEDMEIVRVEEFPTPGDSRFIEVPLGDERQLAVAVKSWDKAVYLTREPERWTHDIRDSQRFDSLSNAVEELQNQSVTKKYRSVYRPFFVGIAIETTPGKPTYRLTVLA